MTPEDFKKEVLNWAEEIKVKPKQIQIRDMRRKVGSCSTKGRLTFCSSLLENTNEKRTEAIVHELLHIKYPNHGKMFNAMLKAYLSKK